MKAFDRALQGIACLLLVVLLTTVLLGVLSRAWGEPLIWTDEGARFVMVWLASFGWMIATRRQGHVRIRYFQGLLPGPLHRGTELVIQLALVVFGCAIAWYGIGLVGKNLELEATSLPLSMALLYVPIIPAGLMMAAQAVGQIAGAGRARSASPIGEEAVE